jgi:hypothetical protein
MCEWSAYVDCEQDEIIGEGCVSFSTCTIPTLQTGCAGGSDDNTEAIDWNCSRSGGDLSCQEEMTYNDANFHRVHSERYREMEVRYSSHSLPLLSTAQICCFDYLFLIVVLCCVCIVLCRVCVCVCCVVFVLCRAVL